MTTIAQQRVRRRYGFPFKGMVSSVDRNEVPLTGLGSDSRDVLIEPGRVPELGKVKRRQGTSVSTSSSGCLEMVVADATMMGVHVWECPTTVSGDGYPVLGTLFVDESKRYGQVYLRDGSTDYTELEEFGSTHYPTAASTQGNIKMPALPYDGNGATGYTRGAFEEARRRIVAGSRNRVGIKNREYFPAFYSTPSGWDRSYNLNSGSGSNNSVRYPTGHIMPLWAPNVPSASYPTARSTAGPWSEGSKFFLAVAFEWEDGSVSMPFIPRDINSTLTAGLGLVTVLDDGDATLEYYDYLPYRDIPIGPPGVRKRRLYRSNVVTKAQLAAGAWPDISTLKLCAIIENNTSTSYNDPRGSDTSLVADSLLRVDQVWPSRGRYAFAFDHRHGIGYLRPNPCAIVLAPTSGPAGTSRGINAGYDDAALVGSTAFLVQLRQDNTGAMTLRLRATAFGAAVPANNTISLAAGTTLQTLVDTINATTTASTGGEWVAQLVPGADANADVTKLAPTQVAIPTCSNTSGQATITTTGSFADIAEGMKINDGAFPAGTYVKTKNSNTSLTMSAASTAPIAAATVEFYADFGDDALFTDATAGSQYGNMRCYGNAYPGIIGFKQSYLDTFPTEKRDFMVTTGSPAQKPNAAHMFHTSPGARYSADSDAGIFMGGAPLKAGFVAFYSNRIGWYANKRSGSTGEDQDYRMEWVDLAHGCKSPYSITYGNGWVGCWRDDGYWIFDGDRGYILTGDQYDPATGAGELAYEAGLCNAAASVDSNDYGMFAHYRDGRLWLNYRASGSANGMLCYDASTSMEAGGTAQMLTPDGLIYGWSARLTYSWRGYTGLGVSGAIGSVRTSSGVSLHQCDNTNDKTRCGLIQKFQNGTWLDGSDPVNFLIYGTTDMLAGMRKFSLAGIMTVLYRYVSNASNNTMAMSIIRNQQRTSTANRTLARTTGDFFTRFARPVPLGGAISGEVAELLITGVTSSDDQDFEVSGVEIEANVLDSRN